MPLPEGGDLTAPVAHAGNDVGLAVAVEVAGGDEHAAGERRCEGEEGANECPGGARERLDVRRAAGAGAGDHVGLAVTIHVARRNGDAAGEGRGVGEEAAQRAGEW